jgi:uncharacterized protein (DUF58 family)
VSDLLDPAFLRELEALRRRLEIRARTGAAGERASNRRGSSAEFADHRPYSPGDDPRRIDWSVYARTGEAFLKLYRAEEDVVARLIVDGSASMRFGTPTKLDVARRLAAAVGYMALARLDRTQLVEGRAGTPRMHPPLRGKSSLPSLLAELGAVEADGKVDLAQTIDTVVQRSSRPGMLVVASDFFDDGRVLSSLARARAAGHDVALLHVVAAEEEAPTFEGDLALVDAETGDVVEVTADAAAIEAYVRRYLGLCEELAAHARKHGATYVRVRTDDALEGAVRRLVSRSVDA